MDLTLVAALLGVGDQPTDSPEAWDATAADLTRQRMAAASEGREVSWDDVAV